ncbi:hypothetical protein LTR85_004420 [Meristemomyces frigidus]|nr:hypothetical protein LTR85_004420 [Meristemomyces frigidus]
MEDLETAFGGGRMTEEFKTKYGARAAAPASPPVRHYGSDELRKIGTVCSKRLPPASAVLAMFQYELRRQSEAETLFQGSMFRLAQTEDASSDHEDRIRRLEEQLNAVQRQLQVKDVEERLATSKLRMNHQQSKLDECASKLQTHNKLLADFTVKMEDFTKAREAGEQPETTATELLEEVTAIKDDVDDLFNEKEAMCTMIEEGGLRISKLEDLVRNLTLQLSISTSPTNGSPGMTQRLPVQTANGQSVDLLVPRGSGITTARENRGPSIRSFTPGEQWAGCKAP